MPIVVVRAVLNVKSTVPSWSVFSLFVCGQRQIRMTLTWRSNLSTWAHKGLLCLFAWLIEILSIIVMRAAIMFGISYIESVVPLHFR